MEVVYPACCGLDVHKRSVTACLLTPGRGRRPQREVRVFLTLTADLERLRDWLVAAGCTHVAMESTGVYWVPLWNVLEDSPLALTLVNPEHFKRVPGRKTDVSDSQWLAQLLRHGLLQPSFVPERAQRELRELTRYRTSLVGERAAEINRLGATLEGANVKLSLVVSDLLGVSARQMLEQLVVGASDPAALAALARGRLRDKLPQLEAALDGTLRAHQRFLLARQLAHIDSLDALIAELDAEVAARLAPFAELVARLDAIPGVGVRTAEIVLAEVGAEVSRFATPQALAAWAGLCPGNRQSAGKRGSGRTRRGNRPLRTALVEGARAAARSHDTALAARYHRLKARRGAKRAAVAVAHTMLVSIWHMLHDDVPYRERGPAPLDARAQATATRRAVHQLERLGHVVTLQPHGAPA